jgi:histidyl-tRNA synthetase
MNGNKKKEISAIKGTKDILPQEVGKWQRLEKVSKTVFELYGYREIRTPVFEATELFEKGTGPTSDIVTKEMYTFRDKGNRSLTLRPEYTPSVVRAIIEHRLHLLPLPLRFYFIGSMFRYDKPQKGRYRQFHQVDIEVFGEPDADIDAEIIEMADFLLKRLSVRDTEVLVNSVGCRACRPDYHVVLKKAAEDSKNRLCEDCRRKIGTNPLRIFDCKQEACQDTASNYPKITDYLCSECENHFRALCFYLGLYGIEFRVDPRLVRGLDYYTKTAFEFVTKKLGAQDAVLGGGRYDDMMKEFGGPDICGTGFAMGVERLLSIMPFEEEAKPWIYIAHMGEEAKKAGMKTARLFRGQNLECLIEYKDRGLKAQLSRANKLGAAWTVIIGETEIQEGKYILKNMHTGGQTKGLPSEIIKTVSSRN